MDPCVCVCVTLRSWVRYPIISVYPHKGGVPLVFLRINYHPKKGILKQRTPCVTYIFVFWVSWRSSAFADHGTMLRVSCLVRASVLPKAQMPLVLFSWLSQNRGTPSHPPPKKKRVVGGFLLVSHKKYNPRRDQHTTICLLFLAFAFGETCTSSNCLLVSRWSGFSASTFPATMEYRSCIQMYTIVYNSIC